MKLDGLTIIEERSAVIRDGVEVILSPQQFRIFLRVLKARYGISAEALTNYIYSDDEDGGPIRGRKAMHVQRVNINHKLEPIHVSIQPHKRGGGGVYEVKVDSSIEISPERARSHPPALVTRSSIWRVSNTESEQQ
jgi:hypothetical protein